MRGKKRRSVNKKRQPSEDIKPFDNAPDTKRQRLNNYEESTYSDDSDIIVIDSVDSDEEVVVKKEEDDDEFDIKPSTHYDPSTLAKWCSDHNIPPNYEKELIGVEYCGIQRVLTTVAEARKRYPNESSALDSDIWQHFKLNGQNRKVYEWKMKVRDTLLQELSKLFSPQKVSLFAVGSTMNGCGSFNSDMDLCLCLPDLNGTNTFDTHRNKTIKQLHKIERACHSYPKLKGLVKKANVIPAKVPIIEMELKSPFAELDLDININNVAGVYNSHLIHYYSRIDSRFPALCLLIKHWAIRKEISDAMSGTFNSYSIILLVLHYLQCGVQPAILPNLQYLFPDLFSNKVSLDALCLFQDLHGLPERPPNPAPIGDLLMGLFHYYDNFDFGTWAISIRAGKKFPRTQLCASDSRFYIFVEEPFDKINTARCVTREYNYNAIKKAFREAAAAMDKKAPRLSNLGIMMG